MISIPAIPGLATLQWAQDAAMGTTTSPFTLERKTYDYGASRLRAVCTTPTMRKVDGLIWMGFFAQIRQTEDPILFGPGALQNAEFQGRSRSPGNPKLNANASGGNVLSIKNLIATDEQIFPAGWFFSLQNTDGESDLYMIAEPMTSAVGSEFGRMRVFPNLRASYAANKWLHFVDPRGQFYVENYPTFSFTSDNHLAPLTFELSQR